MNEKSQLKSSGLIGSELENPDQFFKWDNQKLLGRKGEFPELNDEKLWKIIENRLKKERLLEQRGKMRELEEAYIKYDGDTDCYADTNENNKRRIQRMASFRKDYLLAAVRGVLATVRQEFVSGFYKDIAKEASKIKIPGVHNGKIKSDQASFIGKCVENGIIVDDGYAGPRYIWRFYRGCINLLRGAPTDEDFNGKTSERSGNYVRRLRHKYRTKKLSEIVNLWLKNYSDNQKVCVDLPVQDRFPHLTLPNHYIERIAVEMLIRHRSVLTAIQDEYSLCAHMERQFDFKSTFLNALKETVENPSMPGIPYWLDPLFDFL